MKDVVTMARIVPVGMDFCASLRSPDRFEPAMMPVEAEGGNGPRTHLGDAARPALSGRVRGGWGVGRGFLTMHGRDPRLHGAAVRTLGLTAHCRTAGHVVGSPSPPHCWQHSRPAMNQGIAETRARLSPGHQCQP